MPSYEQQVAISKTEYMHLKKASIILEYLEANGVDNWEWYDDAMKVCRAENPEIFSDR